MGRIVILVFCALAAAVDAQVTQPNPVKSQELSASAQGGPVDAEAKLLLPDTAAPVRGVIAVLGWGAGTWLYDDPAWRQLANDLQCGLLKLILYTKDGPEDPLSLPVAEQPARNAALGGAEALLKVLNEFARQSGRPELQNAKLLFWGHSAAGSFGTTFAAIHPARTVAFVRYHSHLRGLPVELATIARIPALIMAGERDTAAGIEDSETLWKSGRMLAAPWTFAIEPGATHGSSEELKKANDLALPWIRGVITQRLTTSTAALRPIEDASGWLASRTSVMPAGSFHGPKAEASWLPDEASARGWRVVTGTRAQ
ncbi:MAG TPA: hypothetical protein VD833_00055 [Vicinamibacterales bacterium]|nr:hypothetical protein [Vicinamibacterales bacterium]